MLHKLLVSADFGQVGKTCPAAVKNIPIRTTTVQGSKGLAADLVFLTHIDDKYFLEDPKNGECNKDIYKLLVALTRAKMKVHIVSTTQGHDDIALRLIKNDKIMRE